MINIDAICQELRVRPEIYKKILKDFSMSLPEKVEGIQEALTNKDAKKVQEISHEIKGIASNLRLAGFKEIVTNMNTLSKDENLGEAAKFSEMLIKETEKLKNFVENL